MITPSNQGAAFPTYDPLATQFMTGGQMGYMPEAQFLTGAQYGAFRTMPAPTTQYSQAYQQQTLWQSYLMANQGGLPGIPGKYWVDIYNPGVNFHLQRTMASRRMSDAKSAFMGTMADAGFSMGASALTGAAAGLAFGGPVGAAVGLGAGFLAPAISQGYTDRMRGAREMQMTSMAKIFSGTDVSATLGQGFSMSAASRVDEHMRRSASRDMAYKYDDYKGFTREAMSAGLMDFSNDVEQYKQAITRGMKNLKVISGLLGSQDYKEVVTHMKRLMTMGADMGAHQGMMANEHTFARMAGMTISQMVDTYGQQGAMVYNQYGLTPVHGSQMAMSNAARVEFMKRTGIVSAAEVARLGGVSGMAQTMTEDDARFQKETSWAFLPAMLNQDGSLNKQKALGILSGKTSYRDTLLQSVSHAKTPGQYSTLQAVMPERLSELSEMMGPNGMKALKMQFIMGYARQAGLPMNVEGLTQAAQIAGKMSPEQARRFVLEMGQSSGVMADQMEHTEGEILYNQQEEYIRDANPLGRLRRWWRKTAYDSVGSLYGSWASSSAKAKDRAEAIKMGRGPSGLIAWEGAAYSKADFKRNSSRGALSRDKDYLSLERANKLLFKDEKALESAEAGRKELLAAGLDVNEVSRYMRDHLTSASDFTELGVRRAFQHYRMSQGASFEEAAEWVGSLNVSQNMAAYGFQAALEDEGTAATVRGAFAKKNRKAAQMDSKKAHELRAQYEQRIKWLTTSPGMRGALFHDMESADAILGIGQKKGSKNIGLMYAASSMLGRLSGGDLNTREKKILPEKLKEILRKGHMSEEQIKELMTANAEGDVARVDELLRGMLSEEAAQDERVSGVLKASRKDGRSKNVSQLGALTNNALALQRTHDKAQAAQEALENDKASQTSTLTKEKAEELAMNREMVKVLRQLAAVLAGVAGGNPAVLGKTFTEGGGGGNPLVSTMFPTYRGR
ncbi:MAG: hypothetical protein LHW56_01625 [Candidatus Cloacimonetes bacterium]|nr:hypothetical protein [Candidatus Cloacimonadota bacterium]MDY0171587.1 hypothetical protein [Candidatus Cloacimonadaceae bacterium]